MPDEDEDAGLDITEHGMYGYPEQFIPAAELSAYGARPVTARDTESPRIASQEAPAT